MTDSNPETQTMPATRQGGRFAGQLAFITGASSGIGRHTALASAREGANVVVADVAADNNQLSSAQPQPVLFPQLEHV